MAPTWYKGRPVPLSGVCFQTICQHKGFRIPVDSDREGLFEDIVMLAKKIFEDRDPERLILYLRVFAKNRQKEHQLLGSPGFVWYTMSVPRYKIGHPSVLV